ncbi:Uncharacterised protein [Serratia entomophila]|uniref:hypothetical protein n=1 Tax=Serratia entomophila TaxID=42906 RepID=UPI00217865C6|nr:hypothetical protein [Serratia entomophila]CAI1775154.1 Uncharacterised protein [Serratia entomophila]CAI2926327.1 Uncharacterised protein [Serratia entomophila]
MSYFGFNQAQQNRELATAAENPIGSARSDADFFDGAFTAPFKGLYAGVTQADQVAWAGVDAVVSPISRAVNDTFGVNDTSESFIKNQRKLAEQQVRALTPDAGTTGTAGQVLFSLAEVGGQAAAGTLLGGLPGAAATVGGLQGFSDYEKSRADGVDYGTAVEKALVTGGTAALGAVLPMSLGLRAGGAVAEGVGAALTSGGTAAGAAAGAVARAAPDLLYSAGTNIAMGMAQRGLSAEILRRGGYEDMARQYDVFDNQALAVDAVLGIAFGGLGRFINSRGESAAVRSAEPAEIDAALTSSSHLNYEVTASPGVPVSVLSRNAHARAMDKAMTDAFAGHPVDVGSLMDGAEFIQRRPRVDLASQEVRKAMGLPDAVIRDTDAVRFDDVAGANYLATPKPRTRERIQQDEIAGAERAIRGEESRATEADTLEAQRAISDNPDLQVHVVNPDDSTTMVRAADLMAEADRDVANAQHDANLFDVAVSCFLRR